MTHSIDISEASGVRYLHFGSDWVQGAMRIRKPDALELEYTREMLAGLLLRPPPWPRRVLLIGLGAGSLVKFIHRHLPDASVTVVEIDPEVVPVAHHYFKLPAEDERLRIVIGDGAHFVADDNSSWDLIAVDGFDARARAGALNSAEFYQNCRQHLSADGLLTVNLFGQRRGFQTQRERLRKAFGGRTLILPMVDSGNVVALASVADPLSYTHGLLLERAKAIKAETGLNLVPTVKRLMQDDLLRVGSLRL